MLGTLLTTALMVVLYVALVRFVDMNEKEPLWAMLLFFVFGAVVAFAIGKLAPPSIALSPLPRAATEEVGRFLATGAGIAILLWHGRRRGYDEFHGTLDGVVYGATVGLGFATSHHVSGDLLIVGAGLPGVEPGLFDGFGTALVRGLEGGVFGAIVGASLGAAAEVRAPALRALLPFAGLCVAVGANATHAWIGQGNALSDSGLWRARVALGLPAVAIVAVAAYALLREGKTIRGQLAEEVQTGAVTADELSLLSSALRREGTYLVAMFTFRWGALAAQKSLHNLQVQLAFAKEKLRGETDTGRAQAVQAEVATLRSAIMKARAELPAAAAQPAGGAR